MTGADAYGDREYSGTPAHKRLLRAVAAHYAGDARIRAVCVFGSLGRGDWDRYSDLDLDVVVADEYALDVRAEVERLCEALEASGEHALLVIPDGADAADVVFDSLMEISIRYHPLATMSPNIVDSLRVLAGPLEPAALVTAGTANRGPGSVPLERLLDRCVRDVLGVDVAIRRGQFWAAVEQLQRMRGVLMEVFARSRGAGRAYQVFEAEAGAHLQARLGALLPQFSLASARTALVQCLDLLESALPELSAGRMTLTAGQRQVIARIRERDGLRER